MRVYFDRKPSTRIEFTKGDLKEIGMTRRQYKETEKDVIIPNDVASLLHGSYLYMGFYSSLLYAMQSGDEFTSIKELSQFMFLSLPTFLKYRNILLNIGVLELRNNDIVLI